MALLGTEDFGMGTPCDWGAHNYVATTGTISFLELGCRMK